ncbi:MAG: hypothetical protein L0Y36_02395 [Planctomycetales bacterium]|nr:hypothetical protein [Planctomycetales bacterium]
MKYFFIIILPLLWIIVSIFSFLYWGEEGEVYVYANIIGTWPFFFTLLTDMHSWLLPVSAALVGGLTLGFIGWVMDKLRVDRLLWGVLWAAITLLLLTFMLCEYNSVKEHLPDNNPIAIYLPGSMNVAVYFSVIIAIIVQLTVKGTKRLSKKKQ